jgi:hypothetical protein
MSPSLSPCAALPLALPFIISSFSSPFDLK